MRRILTAWVVVVGVLLAGAVHAQPFGGVISVRDSSTGAVVPNVGDASNNAVRVNIVAGAGSGGTSSSFGAVGWMVGELGAGAADPPSQPPFCKEYGNVGGKAPTVIAGTANGLTISVSSAGAGGLAAGSIAATIVAE